MREIKSYDNHLGIKGWLVGGRWGLERYLYSLHRITGVGILLFFLLHIFESSTRAFGQDRWESLMQSLEHPIFKLGEFFVIIGFAFHAFNGIRLILIELGIAVGKAEEPVYPYRTSVHGQRPLSIAVMILAACFIAAAGFDLFLLGS